MDIRAIGTVRTTVLELTDEHWGDVVSELTIERDFADGLRGIEDFSHALVLFWMHQSTFDSVDDLVRRPRGRADLPETGIFAQRAKHRPNPIGVTAVRVVARDGHILRVRGLDALDGTPILDIKPYVPVFDRIEGATTPAWIDEIMKDYF